jgi:hypothetical protein
MAHTALFVTYAMAFPRAVVGVFLRAMRLGAALDDCGWRTVVLHAGAVPDDPKVSQRPASVTIETVRLGLSRADADRAIRRAVEVHAPDVIVFGEGPIEATQTLFDAACAVPVPFVMLDQYYSDWLLRPPPHMDLLLLYGLRPFWTARELRLPRHAHMLPPFIDEVTPPEALPVPPDFAGRPWITALGFDPFVMARAIELAANTAGEWSLVVVTAWLEAARAQLASCGIGPERGVVVPLQRDADLFGLIAGGRAVILANGYMQLMEALALGRPAIAIDRGVGLPDWSLDERFKPYVSIGETRDVQQARLETWMTSSPFPAALATALEAERGGARLAAAFIERVPASVRLSIPARLRRRRRQRAAMPAAARRG